MSYRARSTLVFVVLSVFLVWQLGVLPFLNGSLSRAHASPPVDCTSVVGIPMSECNVLIALYTQTNGAAWFRNNYWSESTACTWYGIVCVGGHVAGIFLSGNNLVGTLPTTLNQMTGLQDLRLASNQLSGSIPSLSGLTVLSDLVLDNNQLSGSIPSLSGLSSLQYLSLLNNQLSGSIPSLNGLTSLHVVDLNNNQLSGSIPLLNGLTKLSDVDLSDNQLSGSLPSLNGLPSLQRLYASGNQLSGSIPSLSGLPNLYVLYLRKNQLSGLIPSLSGLTILSDLVLDNNQLGGSIPSLSGLTGLTELNLDNNQLSGSIPSLSGLTNLHTLVLNNNQLSGSIPSLNGLPSLQTLVLNNNQLSGAVPANITTTNISFGYMTLCGGLNNLTLPDSATNTWIVARDRSWTSGIGCIPETPTLTPIPTPRIDSIGIYRSGTFYLRLANSTGFADLTIAFNPAAQPYPIVGDWTGMGFDQIGVFDQSNGLFSLCTANDTAICANLANIKSLVLGVAGDVPLAGRWQLGAANSGIGVFRPSNGLIYLKNNLTTGFADYTMVLGVPGDVGLAGDWTGKGFDSPGVYRPSLITFYLSNQVTIGSVFGDKTLQYGYPSDSPVVGDWLGQGHDGVGLFRPTNGYTYLRNTLTTGYADNLFVYGVNGDIPVAGHWQVTYPASPNASRLIVAATPVPMFTSSATFPAPKRTAVPGNFDG